MDESRWQIRLCGHLGGLLVGGLAMLIVNARASRPAPYNYDYLLLTAGVFVIVFGILTNSIALEVNLARGHGRRALGFASGFAAGAMALISILLLIVAAKVL